MAVDDFRVLIFIHFLKFSAFFTHFNNGCISVCYVKSLVLAMYIQVLTRASIYRTGGVRAISQFATQCTDALQLFSLRERIELFSPRTAVLSIVPMYCSSAVLPVRVVHTRTRTIFSRSVRALHDLLNCVLKFDCRSYWVCPAIFDNLSTDIWTNAVSDQIWTWGLVQPTELCVKSRLNTPWLLCGPILRPGRVFAQRCHSSQAPRADP